MLSLRLEPIEVWHVLELQPQTAQAATGSIAKASVDVPHEKLGYLREFGFTAMASRSPAACAGVIPQWPGRGLAWMLVDRMVGRFEMLWLNRRVSEFLDKYQPNPFKRIEATTVCGFAQGSRWLRMLGFTYEAEMKLYDPVGRTHLLYSRVRDG